MVEPDLFLKISLIKDTYVKPIEVSLLSSKEIKFKIKDTSLSLLKHDNIKLILEFDKEKIYLEGTIFKIEKKEQSYLITMFIKKETENQQLLEKYIYKREVEILEEFKSLYLHN